MNLEFKKKYWTGIFIALILIGIDLYLYFVLDSKRWLIPLIVIVR